MMIVAVQRGNSLLRKWKVRQNSLGGGFKHFLFLYLIVEDSKFYQYFSDRLKPPSARVLFFFGQVMLTLSNNFVT